MLKKLMELLAPRETPGASPERQEAHVATCVVLLEAAMADDEFTEDERASVVAAMRRRFALSEDEAREVMAEADAIRRDSLDLWQFTHAINESLAPEEKVAVIEEVWRVVYADGVLTGHEDHLLHKLGKLLNLNHKQFIGAKLKVIGETRDR
jgi:uncharacterized tellurite resistance protein B-like protein